MAQVATENYGSPLKAADLGDFFTPTLRPTPRHRQLYTSPLSEKQASPNAQPSPLGGKRARRSSLPASPGTPATPTAVPLNDNDKTKELEELIGKMKREHEESMMEQLARMEVLESENEMQRAALESARADAEMCREQAEQLEQQNADMLDMMRAAEQVCGNETGEMSDEEWLSGYTARHAERVRAAADESAKWQQEYKDVRSELTAFRTVLCKARDEADEWAKQCRTAVAHVAAQKAAIDALESELEAMRSEADSVGEWKERCQAMEKAAEKQSEEVLRLGGIVRERDAACVELHGKVRHGEHVCAALQLELKQVMDERRGLSVKVLDLQKELEEAGAMVEQIKEKFTVASASNEELGKSVAELEGQIEELELELEQKQEQAREHEQERDQERDAEWMLFHSCVLAVKLHLARSGMESFTIGAAELYERALAEEDGVPIAQWAIYISDQLQSAAE